MIAPAHTEAAMPATRIPLPHIGALRAALARKRLGALPGEAARLREASPGRARACAPQLAKLDDDCDAGMEDPMTEAYGAQGELASSHQRAEARLLEAYGFRDRADLEELVKVPSKRYARIDAERAAEEAFMALPAAEQAKQLDSAL